MERSVSCLIVRLDDEQQRFLSDQDSFWTPSCPRGTFESAYTRIWPTRVRFGCVFRHLNATPSSPAVRLLRRPVTRQSLQFASCSTFHAPDRGGGSVECSSSVRSNDGSIEATMVARKRHPDEDNSNEDDDDDDDVDGYEMDGGPDLSGHRPRRRWARGCVLGWWTRER